MVRSVKSLPANFHRETISLGTTGPAGPGEDEREGQLSIGDLQESVAARSCCSAVPRCRESDCVARLAICNY